MFSRTMIQTSFMHHLKSAVLPKDYPAADRPEVAIVGRSNAGKSSLLNAMAGSQLARVSQVPGKTRLLNFYDVGKNYRLVDMPGYGFAARGSDEVLGWRGDGRDLFRIPGKSGRHRSHYGCPQRMGRRRKVDPILGLGSSGLNMILALNKCDKLSRNELNAVRARFGGILPEHS